MKSFNSGTSSFINKPHTFNNAFFGCLKTFPFVFTASNAVFVIIANIDRNSPCHDGS